jgi:predicted dehydrogenase
VASVAWEPIEVPLTDEEKAAFAVRRWSTIGIMRGLIKGIQEDTVPACSGYDGRAALEMIMASYLSQKTGARVGLPLTERRHPLSPWS